LQVKNRAEELVLILDTFTKMFKHLYRTFCRAVGLRIFSRAVADCDAKLCGEIAKLV
jgi:hypothetical protein